ncbi:MAG: tetratricopeptide repeat protein, partial [Prochlorococcus sp.]
MSSEADSAELRQELEINPSDYSALQQLAQIFEQEGKWDELLELAKWQSSLCNDDQRLTGYLDYLGGRALLEMDRPEQAQPRLLRCILNLSDFPYAHNILGRCYAELKDWDLAVVAQERCLALKPDFGYAWIELGRGREQLGESTKAVEAFEKAVVLLPENPWLQRNLAILKISAFLKAGETNAAADQIQSLLGSEEVNEELVQPWLESVASLAACGEWPQAIQLACAIHQGEQLAGRPTPLGTRCTLLFLALGLLLAVDGSQGLNPSEIGGALLETRCLAASTLERQFWQKIFLNLVTTSVTKIVVASPAEQILPDCGALLLAIADVVANVHLEPEMARSLLKAGLQVQGMPAEDQLRLRESSGLLALAKGRYLEALQDFGSIPEEHCSSRALIAVNLCKLNISGLHFPQDLLSLREVTQQLIQQFRQQPRNNQMRRDLEAVLWRLNTRIYQDTEALSRMFGPIEHVQQIRSQGLELLSELITVCLNPPGLPPTFSRKLPAIRWLFVATKSLPQCFLYRVEQKRKQLENLYFQVKIIDVEDLNNWSIANQLLWADRLVVCRLPGTYPVLRMMEMAHRFGVEVLYDMDDLIFDSENFPPPLISYGGTISESVHAGLAMD